MHIGDKQPSVLHTVCTLGAAGFIDTIFEWLKNELSLRALFHGLLFLSNIIRITPYHDTIQIKTHSWAVSLVSVDSSNCSEKHLQSAMSLWSCSVKSSAITSQHCVTVILDSCRALINNNISGLFLKSWNKESAASMKASFIISPSWKDFVCLIIEWLTCNDASYRPLLVNSAVWKTTVVILVPSPFFFSAWFSEESQCRTFYEQFESASQHPPSSEQWW